MNTTQPIIPNPPELPDAMVDVTRLELKLEAKQREIEALEQQAGLDYREVASGGNVPLAHSDQMIKLMAEERTLRAMLERARAVLERAKVRAFTRGVLAKADQMREFLRTRDQVGKQAEAKLAELADLLRTLQENGRQCLTAFRGLRGRNQQTDKGVVVTEIAALAQGSHLQHLAMMDLQRRLEWWRYDLTPPYGGPQFSVGIVDASAALRGEFDQLMGIHELEPGEIAAVRAEMAVAGAVPLIHDATESADDLDGERLMASLPDLDS